MAGKLWRMIQVVRMCHLQCKSKKARRPVQPSVDSRINDGMLTFMWAVAAWTKGVMTAFICSVWLGEGWHSKLSTEEERGEGSASRPAARPRCQIQSTMTRTAGVSCPRRTIRGLSNQHNMRPEQPTHTIQLTEPIDRMQNTCSASCNSVHTVYGSEAVSGVQAEKSEKGSDAESTGVDQWFKTFVNINARPNTSALLPVCGPQQRDTLLVY
eukprot:363169-Chlamydomonas_euryale.AAC.7